MCAGGTDSSRVPRFDHVKVVGAMNTRQSFRHCRAVVHHGGAGTLAAGLRAGVPDIDPLELPRSTDFVGLRQAA